MEADELMDDDLFADLYGEEEETPKGPTAEPAKQQAAPVPHPAVVPPQQHEVSYPEAQQQLQEMATTPAAVQKAIDPRAPPASVNITPIKIENPYSTEDDADGYSGWDAAAAAGASGNTGGAGVVGGAAAGGANQENGSYGFDGMGAGGYGDPQATGSPAIKEDGCVSILHFSCFLFALWALFFEARGRMGWSWLVSKRLRGAGAGRGRAGRMAGLGGVHRGLFMKEERIDWKGVLRKEEHWILSTSAIEGCRYFFHDKDFDRGPLEN